ncbi:GntR family transcriptional regulator [Dactylosporangium sp. NPDC049525]|uniref:GntR family transcriptional regulator n=1 Tax=Dactylosporangium sp. NPDC049525 TaxID=3154730 RepID=UPI0034321CE9
MPVAPITPKYAEIINALQARIDQQIYRVGDLLPSEAQLTREFGASRSTVVRALEYLRQHGWVEGIQGKGRVVLGHPTPGLVRLPRRARLLLQVDEGAALLGIARVVASTRIAAALACPVASPLVARRHLLSTADGVPYGLSTAFATADAAAVLPDGLQLAAHQVVERLGARPASEAEAVALQIPRRRCVVVVLLTVLDAAGRPLVVVDAALSRDVPELASVLPLT